MNLDCIENSGIYKKADILVSKFLRSNYFNKHHHGVRNQEDGQGFHFQEIHK